MIDEPLSLEVFGGDGTFDQAYTYHADHLGSIRFITDSVGNIANSYEYDSYGRPGFSVELIAQPFRYTGREYDEATELYHYRARQYDPETGKFLQEDPIGFAGGDLNLQRYVGNNPLTYTDPSGLTALGRTASTKVGLLASSGKAALGVRLACLFGNISGVVETAGLVASGNLVGATVSGVTSIGSCGGSKVALKGTEKAVVDILNRDISSRFVLRQNGDILKSMATNPSLKRLIDEMFRPAAKIGNGSTQSAALFTKLTGNLVGGSDHLQKTGDLLRGLRNIMNNKKGLHGKLNTRDKAIAETLFKDLNKANGLINL